MKTMPIVWQRLVNATGHTCPRCQGTGDEVLRAVERLKAVLQPLGIEPVLETRELDEATFLAQPTESNRLWIAGQSLEAWLQGQAGSSRCCGACGDSDCRTVEVAGKSYEVIPEELVLRAGLIAGTRLLDPTWAR